MKKRDICLTGVRRDLSDRYPFAGIGIVIRNPLGYHKSGGVFMKKSPKDIIIMSFSHVYEDEKALHKQNYIWMDCTDIKGTNCYLDQEAEEKIKERIRGYTPEGIHFIDSGNYHYVTKLWTDKIKMPFSLIVFDHHTDMQQASLFDTLSCGSWLKATLEENPYLKKVLLVGVKEELIEGIEETLRGRVICLGEHRVNDRQAWRALEANCGEEPVYISIDKDVLRKSDVVTNWDQGSLSLAGLKERLACLMEHEQVIGVDICGEAAANEPLIQQKRDDAINNKVNEELLTLLIKEEQGEYEEVSNY